MGAVLNPLPQSAIAGAVPKVGETSAFLHNPEHRWYWFPRLRNEAVLLLKIFDSRTDGTAGITAHTALAHPDTAADASPQHRAPGAGVRARRAGKPRMKAMALARSNVPIAWRGAKGRA